jgi:hypothetical protein
MYPPKGLLMIMDQIAGKGRGSAARVITRLQGLQLFNSVMGQTYPAGEIAEWLKEACFTMIRTHQLRNAPSSGLVVGGEGGLRLENSTEPFHPLEWNGVSLSEMLNKRVGDEPREANSLLMQLISWMQL